MTTNELKITSVSLYLVDWPLKMKRQHGVGGIQESFPGAIVKIETDGEITGWGEVGPWSIFTGTAEGNVAAVMNYMKPLLLGADPTRVSLLMSKIDKVIIGHPEGKAAVEMALLDIAGKYLGVSVSQMLGGVYRDRVPLSVTISNPDFEADLEWAKHLASTGYNIFKVKTGYAGHKNDLKRLERLREALPEGADFRVDYNQGLDPWTAMRCLRDLDAFGLTFIEQPVKRNQWHAMAELAQALDTPIMADESVFTAADALLMIEKRFADAVAIKTMKHGGIMKGREIAAMAEAAGIVAYGGVMFESGLACAAGLHMVATSPNISLGAEYYSSTWVIATEILEEPLKIENGLSIVPTGPGLGLTVNEDAVKSVSRVHYE